MPVTHARYPMSAFVSSSAGKTPTGICVGKDSQADRAPHPMVKQGYSTIARSSNTCGPMRHTLTPTMCVSVCIASAVVSIRLKQAWGSASRTSRASDTGSIPRNCRRNSEGIPCCHGTPSQQRHVAYPQAARVACRIAFPHAVACGGCVQCPVCPV